MDKLNLDHHISQQFNEELEDIRNHVLTMGGIVEQQIGDAVDALIDGDSEKGQKVVREDAKVNNLEVLIDEECSRILARRQPAASDLRLIVAIIKTITDLERMGDEAEKIGYLATRLAEDERPVADYNAIENMGGKVRSMLQGALDAFARLDPEAAVAIAKQDEKVDREYEAILRQCITFMMEDPRNIKRTLDVMWCARALERIGDHAKNICEYIVYLVHGKDVRHTDIEAVEKELAAKQ
ncbi:MAG: phosphate signaling complex protein PhoU [Gammaproteobacteria bacterium]|nr:phosphate signaling complex protein PhoU [Gammaproteobacteria bacterium]